MLTVRRLKHLYHQNLVKDLTTLKQEIASGESQDGRRYIVSPSQAVGTFLFFPGNTSVGKLGVTIRPFLADNNEIKYLPNSLGGISLNDQEFVKFIDSIGLAF